MGDLKSFCWRYGYTVFCNMIYVSVVVFVSWWLDSLAVYNLFKRDCFDLIAFSMRKFSDQISFFYKSVLLSFYRIFNYVWFVSRKVCIFNFQQRIFFLFFLASSFCRKFLPNFCDITVFRKFFLQKHHLIPYLSAETLMKNL